MDNKIKLETKLVGDITGNFYVPSYQRGYRWSEAEVRRLLDDIYSTEGNVNYCLQPVVVRKNNNKYEVIDGQQRLTTVYLIYRYMYKESNNDLKYEPKFTLSYETREKSEEFLKSIDTSRKEENIDFWFYCEAYETIEEWFRNKDEKSSAFTKLKKYLDEIVRIIWYEVGESEDATDLFTRLNIGKIPLTNAELVKAMFLSKDTSENVDKEKQLEISLQWDNMEKDLHNSSLWFFLTNKTHTDYQTRIDIVLDLITGRSANEREKYYTFFEFNNMYKKQKQSLDSIWREIQQTFLVLKSWHENHELYHKIGYLIASDSLTLQEIYDISKDKTKDVFRECLNDEIKKSINFKADYIDLSYENSQDTDKISKLLLLFNVESVRKIGEESQRFPFDTHKFSKGAKVTWTLEHIHAQLSEGLNKKEQWQEWLKLHIPAVESLNKNLKDLIDRMDSALKNRNLGRMEFEDIHQEVVKVLSVEGSALYLHSIANMALLSSSDNSALNNSTFAVKRRRIIEMDKNGKYIPFCTRMVFFKYYTPPKDNQLHFWGPDDRAGYIEAINEVLKEYLKEEISLGEEKN